MTLYILMILHKKILLSFSIKKQSFFFPFLKISTIQHTTYQVLTYLKKLFPYGR